MKKILILLFVIGALTFVNINLFATSIYGTPGNNYYDNITLNTQLDELNGITLKDFFENNNLDNLNNFSWVASARVSINEEYDNYIDFTITSNASSILAVSTHDTLFSNDLYYMRYSDYLVSGNLSYTSIRLDNLVNSRVVGFPLLNTWNSYSTIVNGLDNINYSYARIDPILNTRVIMKDYIRINLTDLQIGLSVSQIDYLYTIYVLLKNGLNAQEIYDLGYIHGNSIGYGLGLEDYHNGNYNYLDPTTGVSYNDGYNNGLIDGFDNGYNVGEQTGYNNGMDYAATNNLTLLSIFELIIGVVINMLTFIITIEVFGISILSLLSTAALLVGVVWILKLVRG